MLEDHTYRLQKRKSTLGSIRDLKSRLLLLQFLTYHVLGFDECRVVSWRQTGQPYVFGKTEMRYRVRLDFGDYKIERLCCRLAVLHQPHADSDYWFSCFRAV